MIEEEPRALPARLQPQPGPVDHRLVDDGEDGADDSIHSVARRLQTQREVIGYTHTQLDISYIVRRRKAGAPRAAGQCPDRLPESVKSTEVVVGDSMSGAEQGITDQPIAGRRRGAEPVALGSQLVIERIDEFLNDPQRRRRGLSAPGLEVLTESSEVALTIQLRDHQFHLTG
jgi:hypothetical protein